MNLIRITRIVFEVMNWLIIIRVLLSWIRHNPYSPIIRFVYETTEIILGPLRRNLPLTFMGIDFSPIIGLLLIQVLETMVVKLIIMLLY